MLKKISISLIALTTVYVASAQEAVDSAKTTEKALTVSGYVDAYYRFNFANPKKEQETFNNYTSFTNSHNSFELGMASVKLEHSMGKVGVVADLGFGKRAEEFSYNDDKTMLAIKQAYVTYSPKENLKFTAGSFATHVGYELVDPYLNRNYSMSYMFSYGPFFHTGVKADLAVGKSGFMLGVVNPTDLKSANFSRKFLIGQYSYGGEKVKLYLNYQGGTFYGEDDDDSKIHQGDVVLTAALSDKFSLGYNGTVQSVSGRNGNGKFDDGETWWGSALYLNADPTSTFGLTLRGEYFSNENGASAAPGTNIFATTLSANFKVGALTIIPELRHESAKDEIYVKRDESLTKSTFTGLMAVVYKF